jgi:Family of unknown function (DUF5313)
MNRPNGNDQRMPLTDSPIQPDPLRWLWYTFGGGLGSRYREWVLHDVTSPTRWVSQVARAVVQASAMAALAIVVLGTGWITWVSLICGISLSLVYYVAFFGTFAEHRLYQHGYPWGTAKRIMSDRRRTEFGCAATYRPTAAILVDDSLNGVAMIPKRLNSATIGTRQQRLDHRSSRIGQHRPPVMPNTLFHNRPHGRELLSDLDRVAAESIHSATRVDRSVRERLGPGDRGSGNLDGDRDKQ